MANVIIWWLAWDLAHTVTHIYILTPLVSFTRIVELPEIKDEFQNGAGMEKEAKKACVCDGER